MKNLERNGGERKLGEKQTRRVLILIVWSLERGMQGGMRIVVLWCNLSAYKERLVQVIKFWKEIGQV